MYDTLTHLSLASFYGTSANSAEQDQLPQYVASDQVLHCLLAECAFKIRLKLKLATQQPLNSKSICQICKDCIFH